MPTTQAKPGATLRLWLFRGLSLVGFALIFGWGVHRLTDIFSRPNGPAGWGYGFVHGALMPMALPNLLLGHDVPIYAANNTGVSYKLGYTLGVNACGVVFFSILNRRLRQLGQRFLNRGNGPKPEA